MFKFLLKIFKDERGIAPLVAGAAILGGSTLLGSIFGKKKQKVYDPYEALRGQYKTYLGSKLGTKTPYSYNEAFTLDQPEVEKASESTILGKLKSPTAYSGYSKETTDKLYGARKARLSESFEDEMTKTKDMYNRLGLVSSTPGLTAQQDVAESQRLAEDDLSSQLMYEDIARELEAKQYEDQSTQNWSQQGQVLGQLQREAQKFGIQMSEEDIKRILEEEFGWAGQAGSLIGQNPPQVYFEDNWATKLGQTGQDIGSMLLMSSILGGGGGAKK